ncbi:MAG TPA: class I SAM-dependent methyltransferase [Ktedonobacteraceae bacterium]|nr:class I SAM-dependent methyltransferase [Ktedonobacteraceae bacterium]
MKKSADMRLEGQANVNAYFQTQSSFWNDIYSSSDVYAEIHQQRHAAILEWIDRLGLPPGSQALEIGCGAGFMSIELARRGFHVQAIDSVQAMVELTRSHALEAGVEEHLSVEVGDITALAYEQDAFDLTLAIGVIPWIERVGPAMQELARVTRPGGYVILTADNRARLNNLLDPWLNPMFAPLKRAIKRMLMRAGLRRSSLKDVGATGHSRRFIDASLARADLRKNSSKTLGFGPFTLLRHAVLPKSLGVRLHHRLQQLADRGAPILRSTGAQYIVLAEKPMSSRRTQSIGAGSAASGDTQAL